MTVAHDQAEKETTTVMTLASTELRELDNWQVASKDDSEFAAGMVRDVIARRKGLEAKRVTITKPMNAALKAVNALFSPPNKTLREIEALLKGKIEGYVKEIEEKNEKAIREMAEAGSPKEAIVALAQVQQAEAPAGVSVRYKWVAEIVDPKLVPNEFQTPDLGLIQGATNNAVTRDGEPVPIPGVRFEKVPIITSRKIKQ